MITSKEFRSINAEMKSFMRRFTSYNKNKSKYKEIEKDKLMRDWNSCNKRITSLLKEFEPRASDEAVKILNEIKESMELINNNLKSKKW